MKRNNVIFVAVLVVLLLSDALLARPTTADEAQMVVAGWLKAAPQPFGTNLGRRVTDVESFADETGRAAYYIVYLKPSGFVIVSADDLVEPIICFAGDGTYDPSLDNPLGALVTNDLHTRVAAAGNTFSLLMAPGAEAPESPRSKWRHFIDLANDSEGTFRLMSLTCVSDIRVLPLVQSKWGQMTACGEYTYNYYSPEHYPCGCLATALAQVMRYYEYPAAQIGVNEFAIKVADTGEQKAYTRGGDGLGGPYNWGQMPLRPESNCGALTEAGR
ncbi:MAG: C10 family peptidase, partial [Planctomycetota bacterium]